MCCTGLGLHKWYNSVYYYNRWTLQGLLQCLRSENGLKWYTWILSYSVQNKATEEKQIGSKKNASVVSVTAADSNQLTVRNTAFEKKNGQENKWHYAHIDRLMVCFWVKVKKKMPHWNNNRIMCADSRHNKLLRGNRSEEVSKLFSIFDMCHSASRDILYFSRATLKTGWWQPSAACHKTTDSNVTSWLLLYLLLLTQH